MATMYLLHPVCDTFTQTYIWHSKTVMSYDVHVCTCMYMHSTAEG